METLRHRVLSSVGAWGPRLVNPLRTVSLPKREQETDFKGVAGHAPMVGETKSLLVTL